eukprot:TRINITY_DN69963_c0_g1_i1.p1 TRINITY_DN69963_c0_g1~~TRINITY_DN69963_c0_g1_i1.p1  ORF type:complete len:571 (+),score=43.49 TRINITY_DN69963_c0_g1_i1:145-1857(+)
MVVYHCRGVVDSSAVCRQTSRVVAFAFGIVALVVIKRDDYRALGCMKLPTVDFESCVINVFTSTGGEGGGSSAADMRLAAAGAATNFDSSTSISTARETEALIMYHGDVAHGPRNGSVEGDKKSVVAIAAQGVVSPTLSLVLPLQRRRMTSPDGSVARDPSASTSNSGDAFAASSISLAAARVPILNYGNVQYMLNVCVGTPCQHVNLFLDTGSSTMWVLPEKFDVGRSTSVEVTDRVAHMDYEQGSASGYIIRDKVNIGGLSLENVPFVDVEHMTKSMQSMVSDGLLGLGPISASSTRGTVLDELWRQAGVSIFSLVLTPYESASRLVLGMPPSDWYLAETLVYAPVAGDFWWAVQADLRIGGELAGRGICLLDSGTSFLGVPQSQYDAFVNMLLPIGSERCHTNTNKGTPLTWCSCDLVDDVLPVEVHIGGASFSIKGEDLLTPVHGHECLLELQSIRNGEMYILGDTFLRNVVAIYDTGARSLSETSGLENQMRIGLARRSPNAPPGPPSELMWWIRTVAMIVFCVSSCWIAVDVYFWVKAWWRRRYHRDSFIARGGEVSVAPYAEL